MEQHDESSSTISRKRKRKTTSDVWQFYENLAIGNDGIRRIKCLKCGKVYVVEAKSGTSNFIRHASNCFPDNDIDSETTQPRRPPLDQEVYREKVAISIIKHNYPFSYVEHEGTRDVHAFLNSEVKFITRNTAKADVLKIYDNEKEMIKTELESVKSRVCLTTDLWKSIATDGYMTLTAHYIDENWKLQSRVLNFRHVPPPHSGPVLGEEVVNYFQEWGIEKKIFTITLDNAKYNDSLIDHLKDHLSLKNALVCDGEFLHVRCGAHVLNLIVQAGLKVIDDVHKIWESVKYVKGSEARKIKFAELISHLSLKCGNKVRQDMPIRWNSTYLMLESALKYRRAFDQLSKVD